MRPVAALRARLAAGGFEPLLPAQAAVAARLADRQLDAVAERRSNGTAVGRLRHYRWPHSNPCFTGRRSW